MTIIASTKKAETNEACELINKINPTMTVEEFESAKPSYYKLNHGGRCAWHALGTAAYFGNIPLVDHLLKQDTQKELLNLGNFHGMTPLFQSAWGLENIKTIHKIMEKLLSAGANPNISSGSMGNDEGVCLGMTVLNYVAERKPDPKLMRILLSYKAVAEISLLTPQAEEKIAHAELLLKDEITFIYGCNERSESSLLRLVSDVQRLVLEYIIGSQVSKSKFDFYCKLAKSAAP